MLHGFANCKGTKNNIGESQKMEGKTIQMDLQRFVIQIK
jgi:hypothetical protein